MSITELVIAALAVWEIVEIWHHSQLFAGLRARTEMWDGPVGRVLHCPFCLTPWVAFPVFVLLVCRVRTVDWFIYTMAVARLANLGNDVLHFLGRTPGSSSIEPDADFTWSDLEKDSGDAPESETLD